MRTRLPFIGCLLLSAVCLSSIAFAQTNWQKTYGGPGGDLGRSVQQTDDGGYIIAGYTVSFEPYTGQVYLIRTDSQGDTLWTRTYGGSGYSVQQTTDGGYIITGSVYSPSARDYRVYLVKTDAQGDTLWTRTPGDSLSDLGRSVQQTTDGGYIVAGHTNSLGAGDYDVCLIRTNAQGDTLWTRTYGGPYGDEGNSVQQTADGGYVIVGWTEPTDTGYEDVYLIKTNAQGETLWTKAYGGTGYDEGNSVEQTADGGYIIAGMTSNSFGQDRRGWLLKTDASGDTLWTRTYAGGFSAAQQTTDGGYIIAGGMVLRPMNADIYLVRTDASGDTIWTRTYGRKSDDWAYSVQQTVDGAYIIAGTTTGPGDYDVYLVKTNGKMDVGPVSIQSPPGVVDSGISYVPRAVVRNFGLTSGSIVQVTIEIGSGYSQTVQETLVSVPLDTLVFPPWTAEPVGSVAVKCFTSLLGDEDPSNDTIVDSIQVLPSPIHDVGAIAIVSPSGSVRAGDTVIPRARIRNFGNRVERFFDVRFRIGMDYNEKANVADALPAGSTAELAFAPWVAETGNWAVSCSTMLGSDENRANDKVSSTVQVFPQTLAIASDQSDRIEASQSRTYRFYALIQGDTGAVVEVARPSAPPGWGARLCDATGADDLTDTDGDGIPDLGYVAPAESGWFSLDVTAPSKMQGDTASLGQGVFLVAGHVSDRPDIADTAVLSLALLPAFSAHNFPNPFSDHTTFVVGLPEDGRVSLTVYTRAGERVCRILANADLPAGVHLVRWDGVNDSGRSLAPGTYEYLLDFAHSGKTDRIRKRLVLTRQ